MDPAWEKVECLDNEFCFHFKSLPLQSYLAKAKHLRSSKLCYYRMMVLFMLWEATSKD